LGWRSGAVYAVLAQITILVPDYDAALAWFTSKLDFHLVEDTDLGARKRWVVISPDAKAQTRIVLAQASTPEQIAMVGRQLGGRVGFFLATDDFDATYERMLARGVHFRETPRHEPYGKVVVFEDCCGNGWDLLEAGLS
jgi:catechol 2,3-dioxygenase-like lactoylglutathione lyase family enzyme